MFLFDIGLAFKPGHFESFVIVFFILTSMRLTALPFYVFWAENSANAFCHLAFNSPLKQPHYLNNRRLWK